MRITLHILFASFVFIGSLNTSLHAQDIPTTTGVEAFDAIGRIKTLNKTGTIHPTPDPVTRIFVDECTNDMTVLEIGGGIGIFSKLAVEKGAHVYLNDLSPEHLSIFQNKIISPEHVKNVTLCPGSFPDGIALPNNIFDAILTVRVFHFFDPETLRASFQKLWDLLKDGGKIFIVADTPYLKSWSLLPTYLERKKNGDPFPGLMNNASHFAPYAKDLMSEQVHLLDPDVLKNLADTQGFDILFCDFLARPDYPENAKGSNKESVGLIAQKRVTF